MSNFPTSLDDDSSIFRVDDNISQIGTDVLNQLRSAVFSVESNLGLSAKGSLSDLSTRLNISLNADGTIKASALSSIGLVTLPITNAQVGNTAGILESKLALNFGTSYLNTLIQANSVLLASLSAFEAALETKLNSHIAGGPASNLRHTASMIDINAHPSDSRDPGYVWAGLVNKDGYALSAGNVSDALLQINTNLTNHQNQITDAHDASAISVDTSSFNELLQSSNNVQAALQNIDNIELLQLGTHREVQHSNGVPNRALALNLNSLTTIGSDGYNIQVVSPTPITAHVAHAPPGTSPVDNVTNGDSIVAFIPTNNTGSIFDAQFSQVKVGDIIRLNYGIGIEDLRRVESIKYVPGSTWTVRVNGVNLRDTDGYTAFARIDRPLYDINTNGVLAVAAANAVPLVNYSILGSVIVNDPRGANAVGINFNPAKITKDNCNLYLQLYPTGNPIDHSITLPGIDVSGDLGTSTGKYTLELIVQNINNAFRKTGYNYRFIAYAIDGNIGISLADSIDGASFAIISGSNSTGSLTESTFTHNVVGDVYGLGFDGLGFGINNANIASPAYQGTWVDSTAAQIPTKVIHPVKSRNYIVNGRPFDGFRAKPLTTNGFWVADIDARTSVGSSIEVTYKINKILNTAGLKPGKTIIVQPAVGYSDPLYNDVDYGRFIIKEVIFNPCQCLDEYTLITVISGIHGTGNPISSSSDAGLPVRLYFGEDSVSFDDQNIIDNTESSTNYHRLFEIYITDSKTTFAHERARMPYQSATGNLITSNFFHIDSVSSKFRGYRDSGITLNKYIRFYVLNYNSTTGEYDGYLGQRSVADNTISKTGPIIRARKNVKARFYDDTNIDYIDLTYIDESNSTPGSTITSSPAYVDIELFDSLESDGELLLLATCEVNWSPDTGKNIVDKVVDKKQHGSISEFEFTQSAKNYISAGEKHLHGNGIVKGFELESSGKIHGGLALVNGKFVITNPTTINIPLCTNLTAPPQTLDWILCVNENGNLVNLPLTATKSEFFARDGYSGLVYYLESVSFIELINRKDLTPLYIYNVTITTTPSVVINTISDVRKYVKNETSLIPLVWSGKDGYDTDSFNSVTELVGHFTTFDQVKNWINWTKSPSNVIKLKGTITSAVEVDLTTLNYPTIFDGSEGCLLKLSAFRGMKLKSGITLKNINFQWSPATQTYDNPSNNVNVNVGGSANTQGCIYINGDGITKTVNDLVIDNCKFTGIFPNVQRPPYITIIGNANNIGFENIQIINNRFTDPNSLIRQCAIIVFGITSCFIANSSIEKNIANNEQSIIFTNPTTTTPIIAANVSIEKNNVGAIGFMISNAEETDTSGYLTENYSHNFGLLISKNTATYIGNLSEFGYFFNKTDYTLIGGNVIVEKNNCDTICAYVFPSTTYVGSLVFSSTSGPSFMVSKNNLKPKKTFAEISAAYGLSANTFFTVNAHAGIFIDGDFGNQATVIPADTRSVQVLDNNLGYFYQAGTLFQYDYGIFTNNLPVMISRNIIKRFNAFAIEALNFQNITHPIKIDINFNQIYLPSDAAGGYIYTDNAYATVFTSIVNNFADLTIMPNGNTVIAADSGLGLFYSDVKNNTNQPFIQHCRAIEGNVVDSRSWTTQHYYSDIPIDTSQISIIYGDRSIGNSGIANTFAPFNFIIKAGTGGIANSLVMPTNDINYNVRLISASVRYELLNIDVNTTITLRLMSKSLSSGADIIIQTVSFASSTPATGTLTLTPTSPMTLNNNNYYGTNNYFAIDIRKGTTPYTVDGTIAFDDLVLNLVYN